MDYFLITEEKKVTNSPIIINWSKKINTKFINPGEYTKIPDKQILYIKSNKNNYYIDAIFHPFFLINKKLKKILSLYEPNLGYRKIILIDFDNETSCEYFLPHLRKINCLAEGTVYNLNHSILKKIVLSTNNIKDCSIFMIDNVDTRYIIVREDLLESFLRRGAIMKYEKVEIN